MKSLTFTSFLLLLFTIIINDVAGRKCKVRNVSSNVDKTKVQFKSDDSKDKFFLIFVNNTAGEISIYNNDRIKKREEIEAENFIFTMIDDIQNIIIDNKDTYENQEKFKELEEETKLRKRSEFNFGDSQFIYPIASVENTTVLYGYLSEEVAEKVCNLENITRCTSDKAKVRYQSHYNLNDIKKETKWKTVVARKNADFHLSLISQGKYDKKLVNKYDNTYYYPKTAGSGVDVIVIDSGFSFNYSEFTGDSDRTVKCLGFLNKGKFKTSKKCEPAAGISHGQEVSDIVGGKVHGVAPRANIYGIALGVEYTDPDESDILGALQYIKENKVRANKTIINVSLNFYLKKSLSENKTIEKLVNQITKLGGIIVASASSDNENIDSAEQKYHEIPCAYKNVICVGGYENSQKKDFTKVYQKGLYSSYGKDVDIFAPAYVKAQIISNKKIVSVNKAGTSYSTAIVSGVIANIISNFSSTTYTKDSILKALLKNTFNITYKKQTLRLINNGKHIVYSEDGVYHGCGVNAGNTPCKN